MIAEALDAGTRIGWAIVAWICVGAAVATGLCVGLGVGVWAVGRAGVRAWRGLTRPLSASQPPQAPRLLPTPERPAGARTTKPSPRKAA